MIYIPKTFKSFTDLKKAIEADIKQKINNTLENEVADVVIGIVQKHIEEDIYGAGHPKYYQRRYHNGGLIDDDNFEISVKNETLTISNAAKFNPSKAEGLSKFLIDGYGDKDTWYNQPRPYMENSNIELENNDEIQRALDNGLKRQGIRRVK